MNADWKEAFVREMRRADQLAAEVARLKRLLAVKHLRPVSGPAKEPGR